MLEIIMGFLFYFQIMIVNEDACKFDNKMVNFHNLKTLDKKNYEIFKYKKNIIKF